MAKIKKDIQPGFNPKYRWDMMHMLTAMLFSLRSKDPNTQVGACVVNNNNVVMGLGYNGFPRGIGSDDLPWDRKAKNPLDTKYPYVVHAERNAILNAHGRDLTDCTIYVSLFPCNECAKEIIQSGIRKVVYVSDKYADSNETKAAKILFDLAGIELQKLEMPDELLVSFTPEATTLGVRNGSK